MQIWVVDRFIVVPLITLLHNSFGSAHILRYQPSWIIIRPFQQICVGKNSKISWPSWQVPGYSMSSWVRSSEPRCSLWFRLFLCEGTRRASQTKEAPFLQKEQYVSNSRFNKIFGDKNPWTKNPKHTSKKTKSCCVGPFHCKDTHCHIGDQFQLQNNDKNLRSCPDLLDKRLRRKLRGPKSLPLLTDWMRCFVGCWDMLGYKCNIFPVGKRVLFLPISITHSIHVPTFIPSKSQQNIDVGKYTVRPMDPMLPCDFEDSGVLLLLIYIDSLVGNTHHPWPPGSKSLPISQKNYGFMSTGSWKNYQVWANQTQTNLCQLRGYPDLTERE